VNCLLKASTSSVPAYGGEEGALKGPSIMPGGQKDAYELVAPILTKIAAVAEDGEPCVTYIGADGAGHYVKMVHNGIEYGDMQLIAKHTPAERRPESVQ
jgi:6-phosphogluconate dehydrogenase